MDELDQWNGKSKVIYDLTRLEKADSRLSLVTVNYELSSLEDLSSRARSVFSPGTISFSPYSKGQIIDILDERVDKAFRPNSVPSEVLEKIADFASASGDCRLALQCLGEGANSLKLGQIESVLESKQG
ncbi:hypothetical protein K9M06_00925 [Candidatus Bipolaricaulota bacterium]|nr:hypothetical protein [Candidatus Bipolaricaulota bacterium]